MRKEKPSPGAHIGAQLRALNDAAGEIEKREARSRWAIRVLDTWSSGDHGVSYETADTGGHSNARWIVVLMGSYERPRGSKFGPTPDAARLAAAESVWLELPEAERQALGACP